MSCNVITFPIDRTGSKKAAPKPTNAKNSFNFSVVKTEDGSYATLIGFENISNKDTAFILAEHIANALFQTLPTEFHMPSPEEVRTRIAPHLRST